MKTSLKEFKGRFDQAEERTAIRQWKLLSLKNRNKDRKKYHPFSHELVSVDLLNTYFSEYLLWPQLNEDLGLPRWLRIKESVGQGRTHRRLGFDPWEGKVPWRRKGQPTPVFLPGKFHGQRSLVGHSPWGYKESDTTEWLSGHTNEVQYQ